MNELKYNDAKITAEVVTPEIARKWLDTANTNNRNISAKIVKYYAVQMKAGQWDITPTPITFDTDGILLDGQHRLNAVILANTPVSFRIARGYPKSSHYDDGKKRSTSDCLKMGGMGDYSNAEIAVCRLSIEAYKHVGYHPTNTEIQEWFERNDVDLLKSVISVFKRYGKSEGGSVSTTASHIILAGYGMALRYGDGALTDLDRITKILKKGRPTETPGDEAIIKLRNAMLTGFTEYGKRGNTVIMKDGAGGRIEKLKLVQQVFENYHNNLKGRKASIDIPRTFVLPVEK